MSEPKSKSEMRRHQVMSEPKPREWTVFCELSTGWWNIVEYPDGFHPKGETLKVIERSAYDELKAKGLVNGYQRKGLRVSVTLKFAHAKSVAGNNHAGASRTQKQ